MCVIVAHSARKTINLVVGDHTPKLEDCGTMGAGLDPRTHNAVPIIWGATADKLDTARLSRISQKDIGPTGKVGGPVQDRHLVVLFAPVGTGQLVNQENIHGPLCRAIQGRVPPCRGNVLAEDESFNIARNLDNKY